MKNKFILLFIFCLPLVACVDENGQVTTNDSNDLNNYNIQIEQKKSELSEVDTHLLRAKIKLAKIRRYIALKLEELRKLYSGEPGAQTPDTDQVPPVSLHEVEKDLEDNSGNTDTHSGESTDEDYDHCNDDNSK